MRVEKQEFAWEFPQLSQQPRTVKQEQELTSESLHESFLNSHASVKREQQLHESGWELRSESLHESWEARVCMRVEKREFAWEFSQLSCPGQTRTRVAWELRSESLYASFLNSHAPVKREQELHESWEARVCMRVFSTLVPRSNENKSCIRVDWILPRAWQKLIKIWTSPKSMRVAWRSNASESCNYHQPSPRLTEVLGRQGKFY
jgi:hypothetical protein